MDINDRHQYYKVYLSVCSHCVLFDVVNINCKAFKNGIPVEILNGSNDHSKPLKGQNNDIVFESIN